MIVKLTLKKLQVANHLSEETIAFTADLYVDGKKAFHVSNRGNGGCNMYMPYVGAPPLFQLESWAQQTTGETFEALDLIVGKLADQIEQEKALKKAFKKQVLMIDDGKIFGWNFSAAKNHTLENLSKHIKAKYPQATILNTIPLEEAAQLVLALP